MKPNRNYITPFFAAVGHNFKFNNFQITAQAEARSATRRQTKNYYSNYIKETYPDN